MPLQTHPEECFVSLLGILLNPFKLTVKPGIMAHYCNPSTVSKKKERKMIEKKEIQSS
jgi:hypothetical protein